MNFVRKISCNELLYADMQDVLHSYASQYVMEIKSLKSEKKLEQALNAAVKFNSGSNLFLKRKTFYDVDHPMSLKYAVSRDKILWDSDFFNEKVDYRKESILAYVVSHNKKRYFVLKISHSAMDGKGGLLLINNIFRFMNNEKMERYDNLMVDRELVKQLPYKSKNESKFPRLKPKNAKVVHRFQPLTRVIELDSYTDSIVAKIARIFADEFEEKEVRLMVPSDLRRYRGPAKHCGNLVLPIMLRVDKNDDISTINGKMLMGLKNKDELNIKNTSYFCYLHLPKYARHSIMRLVTFYARRFRRFSIAGVISYLGKVDLSSMQSNNLKISSFVSIPPAEPLGPFIVSIVEYNNTTRIALRYYEGQYSKKYIDNLCKQLKEIER